jgi:hypothetical protein
LANAHWLQAGQFHGGNNDFRHATHLWGSNFQVSAVENSKPDKPNGLMQRSLEGLYFKGFARETTIFARNG